MKKSKKQMAGEIVTGTVAPPPAPAPRREPATAAADPPAAARRTKPSGHRIQIMLSCKVNAQMQSDLKRVAELISRLHDERPPSKSETIRRALALARVVLSERMQDQQWGDVMRDADAAREGRREGSR